MECGRGCCSVGVTPETLRPQRLQPREIGPQVAELARERGLLINAPRPDALRFMPALTITREEIDQMVGILDGVLTEISG